MNEPDRSICENACNALLKLHKAQRHLGYPSWWAWTKLLGTGLAERIEISGHITFPQHLKQYDKLHIMHLHGYPIWIIQS